MPTRTQIEAHRRDLSELTSRAKGDLRLAFGQFDTAEAVRDGLMDLLPRLVALYGSAAATLAADWYDEIRESDAARGRFSAIPAVLPDQGRTDALARWGTGPLFTAERDITVARSLVGGGLQRTVADMSRQTITGSASADPGAVGWKRIGTGACGFCRMLIARDETYREATADFASHDDCNCSAYPLIEGAEPVDVKDYVPTTRNVSAADRARVREYLRTH